MFYLIDKGHEKNMIHCFENFSLEECGTHFSDSFAHRDRNAFPLLIGKYLRLKQIERTASVDKN